MQEFSQSVIEQIGSYVYLLRDPRDKQIFYIGKGLGNRIFAHVNDESMERVTVNNKLDRIREIHAAGLEVEHHIVRYGLTDKEAFEVEAALIDVVGLPRLTNAVYGYDTEERGLMSVSDVAARYSSQPAEIGEPVILITVNRLYHRGISTEMLYEVTRGKWILGERRNKAQYAFAVYRGIIREVYEIENWELAPHEDSEEMASWIEERREEFGKSSRARWQFNGKIADDLRKYIGLTTHHLQKLGSQNPIKYVNC